ncbi:hypothetical protein HYW35_00765 [Candidatus Saccharibacteria bacterium]|nr:hypothetical protein [Candidatus Saccharibacteria bacterium]
MKIIAHRGARGILTENSLPALKFAADLPIDAIEFDVRVSQDKKLVICHNQNLKNVYGLDKNIGQLTLEELQKIKSPSGETILTLEQVMEFDFGKTLVLDIKQQNTADLVHETLQSIKVKNAWSVTSLFPANLVRLKQLYPKLDTNLQTYKRPLKTIRKAQEIGATSVTLVLYLLNPLTYWWARRAGLKVWTYQNYLSFLLTWRWLARLLFVLYPSLTIVTDRPDKIASLKK